MKPPCTSIRRVFAAISAFCTWEAIPCLSAQAIATHPTRADFAQLTRFASDPADETDFDRVPPVVLTTDNTMRRGWIVTYGPYTRHTGKGPYNSHPHYTGLEWLRPDRWAFGASHFSNSFSQPCWFAHASRLFNFTDRRDGWFCKIAMGVIHGYKPPHASSVPLNVRGFCPAIIPSIGYKYKGVAFHLAIYGKNAGQMPLFSRDLR